MPTKKTQPKPEPKPKPVGRQLIDLEVGENFQVDGKTYQVISVGMGVATVMELATATIKIGGGKTKEITHGIARHEMPLKTKVD